MFWFNAFLLILKIDDNTWFGSSIKLNQQDILRDIHPKTKAEYDYIDDSHKRIVRSQSMIWPSHSEYVQMFALKSTEWQI